MKRILVIDDEALTLNLMQNMLEDRGYKIVTALNGEQGLDRFRQNPADLVITDMVMPVKDGLKTILELREIDENVPVLAISGGGVIAKERYLAVAGYLSNVRSLAKPFTQAELLREVELLLKPSR